VTGTSPTARRECFSTPLTDPNNRGQTTFSDRKRGLSPIILHTRIEPDSARETVRAFDAAGGEVNPSDATTAPIRNPAGRPTHPAAYVKDVVTGDYACGVGKCVDCACAAIVILIEVFQILFSERIKIRAARCQLGEDFFFVDWMRMVEADDARMVGVAH
jgi:hypothetical protein